MRLNKLQKPVDFKTPLLPSCFALFLFFYVHLTVHAQTGPGGVGVATGSGTLHAWWRGDTGVTSSGGFVSAWADQSGYGNTLTQATGANQPSTATSVVLNNQTIIRYTGSPRFFNSSFSGPGVDNITLFLVANGTDYQSLMRFQNTVGTYVVYPYSTAPNAFITSTDGGSGGGISAGLVNNVNNVGVARYQRNVATNGMQTFRNGALVAQRTSVNTALPSELFFSGRYNPGGIEYATADVGELIVYYTALNDAQIIIVQNYLAAKFDVSLTANDVYTMDDLASGHYDFDVAGIGRVNASNIQNDSRGTGIVRIQNPANLDDGEYLMWGRNTGAATATNTTDIPGGISARFARTWRVSETGEVGSVDLDLDVTGLTDFASRTALNTVTYLRLLVDTDNDGVFTDEHPVFGATSLGSNVYRFTGISTLNNGNRFTFALAAPQTYYSLGSGAWEDNTRWSLSADGSGGPLPAGVYPSRIDNVVIRAGHTITVNAINDNGSAGVRPDDLAQANIGPFVTSNISMFYHTGDIVLNGTLTITGIEAMLGGYTEILSGGTLTAGSNLINTGYLEAASGSSLSTLDDLVLTGNSVTVINTASTSSDDIVIDHTDATLCGTGSTTLQNGSGSQITYTNGGTINQVCTTFTIACTGSGCAGTFPIVGTTLVIEGGNGPAGVGITNGASHLVLWMDATRIGAANNATVTSWSDLSGYGFNFTTGNGATYRTNAVNGYSVLEFNGTSNYFERAYTAALNPANFSVFTASNVTSTAIHKSIISSRDGTPMSGTRGYILYSLPTSNSWSFWNGNSGAGWNSLDGISTAGTWASQGAWFNSAINTKFLSINNGASGTQIPSPAFSPNTVQNIRIGAGQNESIPNFFFNGRIGEVIIYNASTNAAQVILLNNYLAAKYNFTPAANDLYTMDNDLGTARDDYDHQVAGIGQATAGVYHRDARGPGIVRMWNPNNLGNNEYLLWGHNNATLTSTTSAVGTVDGTLIRERLTREWAVSETGDVGTVSISFDLTSFSGGFLGSNLRLLIDRDGDGYQDNDVTPLTGSFAANTIIFSGVNLQSGDRFTLGNTNLTLPLPITLLSFTATPQVSSVSVDWETSSELNNDHFEVLRSGDAEQWNAITTVPGAGTSNEVHEYRVSDDQPINGISYYKLKQTDFDGHFSYSAIVRVEFEGTPSLSVSPNPSTGVFDITYNGQVQLIDVFNSLGQKVAFGVNDAYTQIDLSTQPAGVYLLKVISKEKLRTVRLVKH